MEEVPKDEEVQKLFLPNGIPDAALNQGVISEELVQNLLARLHTGFGAHVSALFSRPKRRNGPVRASVGLSGLHLTQLDAVVYNADRVYPRRPPASCIDDCDLSLVELLRNPSESGEIGRTARRDNRVISGNS